MDTKEWNNGAAREAQLAYDHQHNTSTSGSKKRPEKDSTTYGQAPNSAAYKELLTVGNRLSRELHERDERRKNKKKR